ncbi:hypothetical protein ACWIB8_05325 [Corynebacterium flavescens]
MKRALSLTAIALAALTTLTACANDTNDTVATQVVTTVETTTTTTTAESKEEKAARISKRLDAMAPINQVDEGNLNNACIMAIQHELTTPSNLDFPVPVDMGEPDSAGIYSDRGKFIRETSAGPVESSYFCIVYTENGAITDSSATVVG